MEDKESLTLANVFSILAGKGEAQLQVWRNIKTQLRADMEPVMQKSEDTQGGVELGKERRTREGVSGEVDGEAPRNNCILLMEK